MAHNDFVRNYLVTENFSDKEKGIVDTQFQVLFQNYFSCPIAHL